MDIKKILEEKRSSQATIGLTKKEFYKLIPYFEEAILLKPRSEGENYRNAGRKGALKTIEQKLFFILFYLKTYPTYDVLGASFDMHRSNACRGVHYYLDRVMEALDSCGAIPKRSFKSKREFVKAFPNIKIVITDGTERRRRRPKDSKKQKELYSGKKKSIA